MTGSKGRVASQWSFVRAAALTGALWSLSSSVAWAQAAEPEEPALVLPTYVLEIEDLRVETVEAGLPEEQDLLPPERSPPLPAGGELDVKEPNVALTPPSGDAPSLGLAAAPFFVEGTVGAGSLHHLVSRLSIYRPGAEPRFKLAFSYDMMDGLGGNPAGAGFHRKTDSLEGSLEITSGAVRVSGSGIFRDEDIGLQGQTSYESRIRRATVGAAGVSWDVSDLVRLSGGLDGTAAALLLTRGAPDALIGYRLTPRVGAELASGPFRAGLELAYTLSLTDAGSVTALHRFHPRLSASLDLPLNLAAAAEVGWHYRLGDSHLVPFSLALSGVPLDPLWFRLAGGYRVVDHDRGDLTAMGWTIPLATDPSDERGWFGEATVRVSVAKVLLLSGSLSFSRSQGVPAYAATPDPTSGLLTVEQVAADRLEAGAGLRWDLTRAISARIDYARRFIGRQRYESSDDLKLAVEGSVASGKAGGLLEARLVIVPEVLPLLQVPRVDASAFVRFSANVRVVAEVTDLLLPLTGAPRLGIPPFVEPGFGASVRLLVSL